MVVGSGLLALPGLAYRQSGSSAIYAWMISGIISIPFLIVFGVLGSKLPGAGGVASFVQIAFSRRASIPVELLLLGTFVVGAPAIMITGGNYFATALALDKAGAIVGSGLVLASATTLNYLGARISGRVQQVLAAGLVLLLVTIAALALLLGNRQAGTGIAPLTDWVKGVPSVGLVFFAFVGWEMMSFTTEEFRNPRRDFPIMIAVSFVIVCALYLLIMVAIQLTLPINDEQNINAPIAALLGTTFGEASGRAVAVIGLVMILANFISGSWAASRLAFSSAREGLLPALLSHVDANKTPRNAVLIMSLCYIPVSLLYYVGGISLGALFQLAGVNFFTLYGLSVIAFIKVSSHWYQRVFGGLALLLVIVVMTTFGAVLIFPLVLLMLGGAWSVFRMKGTAVAPVVDKIAAAQRESRAPEKIT